MFDSSTCFGPTGPSSGASINCVLLVWYVKVVCNLVRPYVRWLWNNHLTYGRIEQHTIFTYQTSSTQFIDAPEDGPVGPKHVELSNILRINIQACWTTYVILQDDRRFLQCQSRNYSVQSNELSALSLGNLNAN